ncbi:MAG: TonB-dependent receptor, partial [Treponema sp.]|nr:TonB-dependent receptor [Treponema sp.]
MALFQGGAPTNAAKKALPFLCLAFAVPLAAQEWDDAPVMEAEGITVVGTSETTQRITIVDRAEIEKSGAGDLARLLEDTAGLGTTRYGPYGSQGDINVRGFDSERVAFLINGIPANSTGTGEFDYNQIDLASVERVEVIYGGSDTKYNVSGAIGGVINIITVKRQKPGLRLRTTVSNTSSLPGRYYEPNRGDRGARMEDLLDNQKVTIQAEQGLDAFSWTASAFTNRAENHFLYTDPYDRTRRKEGNEVRDAGASVSLIREFPGLTRVIAAGNFYYADKNVPLHGYSRISAAERDYAARENILVEMPEAFHENFSMEASLSHSWQETDYRGPSDHSRQHEHSFGLINRWGYYPLEALTLRWGADYRYALFDDGMFHDRHDGGVYAAAEWSPLEKLLIIASLKAAFAGDRAAAVPKLGLLWKATDSLSVKNNYFRSFKFPDLSDLYYAGAGGRGNADLKPEEGWGADLGAEWRKEHASLGATTFVQWYDNSIHWYSSGSVLKPQNVGGALFYGADVRGSVTIPFDRGLEKIVFSASFQYMESYLLAYGYHIDDGKRIPYMPRYSEGGGMEVFWKTGSFA